MKMAWNWQRKKFSFSANFSRWLKENGLNRDRIIMLKYSLKNFAKASISFCLVAFSVRLKPLKTDWAAKKLNTKLYTRWSDIPRGITNIYVTAKIRSLTSFQSPCSLHLRNSFRLFDLLWWTLIDFVQMASDSKQPVVSTAWLNDQLRKKRDDFAILDVTWFSDKNTIHHFSK